MPWGNFDQENTSVLIYGPMTAAAGRKFKREEKLGSEEFGDVGPGTIGRLDELFTGAEPKPPPGPTP